MKREILSILVGCATLSSSAAVILHDSTNRWNVVEGDASVAANYQEQTLPGTNTQVRIANGGTMTVASDLSWGALWAGYGGNGFVSQTAGHLMLNNAGAASGDGTLWLGFNETDIGRYDLKGGTLEAVANPQIGRYGIGYLAISGGTAEFRGSGYPSIGRMSTGCGHIEVSGAGMLSADRTGQVSVGEGGWGTLTVRDGGQAAASKLIVGVNGSGKGVLNVCSGGVVRASQLYGGAGSVRRVNAVGGTIQATTAGGTSGYLANTDVRVGSGGLRFDTDGYDAAISAPLRKDGLFAADLVHRWSFNGDLTDSVGGQTAILQGSSKSTIIYENNQIRLPGAAHTAAYISLGAGIIPTQCAGVTIEMWMTAMGSGSWSRVFTCNGKSRASEGFIVLNTNGLCMKTGDGSGYAGGQFKEFTIGQSVYLVIRFMRQDDESWKLCYQMRDAWTGGIIKNAEKTIAGSYEPADFAADRFNLGWSTDGGNDDANIRFDEVRVWKRALTDAELVTSATLGPDADFAADSAFVKTGAGQLSLAVGNDYVGPTRVEAGQLVAASAERPVSRWSFNGTYVDSVGGRTATPTGSEKGRIVLGETFVTLPGAEHEKAYLTLGGGVWSDVTDGFTFEFWVRQNTAQTWARIFTCSANEYTVAVRPQLFMTLVGNADPTKDVVGVLGGDGTGSNANNMISPWTLGQWFHASVVGRRQENGTWQISFAKHDVSTGARLKSYSVAAPAGWTPDQLKKSSFNIGWSADPGNYDAAASFDEVRVWKRALSDDELVLSTQLGPDTLPVLGTSGQMGRLPATTDLSVAAGATFALADAAQTVRSLAGTGTVQGAGTLTVTEAIRPGGASAAGTLTLTAGAKLVGTCEFESGDLLSFAAGSAYDVSGLKVKVADPKSVVMGSPRTIISAAGATLAGDFDLSDPSMARLELRVKSTGEIAVERPSGLLVILK